MSKLEIRQKVLGMVSTNCYFLMNKDTKEMILVDPADGAMGIENIITSMGAKPVAILLTHGHFDHILAADEIRTKYGIKIYAQEEEEALLTNPEWNLSSKYGHPYVLNADEYVRDNQRIELAGFTIRVMHTPGHTKGSTCYFFEDEGVLISGDTLFAESVGRTDFVTSSMGEMTRSIERLLTTLDDAVEVYPGHMDMTTIAHEKRYNPFA